MFYILKIIKTLRNIYEYMCTKLSIHRQFFWVKGKLCSGLEKVRGLSKIYTLYALRTQVTLPSRLWGDCHLQRNNFRSRARPFNFQSIELFEIFTTTNGYFKISIRYGFREILGECVWGDIHTPIIVNLKKGSQTSD